jgi:diketogulonate reductase-like aldo/keto reductase
MSSLSNFNFADVSGHDDEKEPYIDTLVLHSPMPTMAETLEVWQTLEQFVPGEIRNLGISNCNLFTLMELYERSNIKPVVVQNRFYADTKFDIGLRKFCEEKGIIYEAFWTLTANPSLLRSLEVRQLSDAFGISPQAALYCLVLGLGKVTILNGTTNPETMVEDWRAIKALTDTSESNQRACDALMMGFKHRIGQLRA